MANNSSLSRREALRQQQEQEERRRRNKRLITTVVAALVALGLVIGGVFLLQYLNRNSSKGDQLRPPNATDQNHIRSVSQGVEPSGDVPHVVAYEDFQCPGCAQIEASHGKLLEELVDEGKITMDYVIAHFMDRLDPVKEMSLKPAIGAAAADAVGKFREYHRIVFDNQPEHEGDGYTEDQLRIEFPQQAGIEGENLARFQKAYDERAYEDFVRGANQTFTESGFKTTPTYTVNGKKFEIGTVEPTKEKLLEAINEAAKE